MFCGQSGGASRWRVCYQWVLPRLVFKPNRAKENMLMLQKSFLLQITNDKLDLFGSLSKSRIRMILFMCDIYIITDSTRSLKRMINKQNEN